MKKYGLLILRIAVAFLLIQTLYFKLSAHPESVYIFTKVGLEPYGRIGIAIVELIGGILLLVKRTTWAGAGISVGVISGAVFMHLTKLGIEVQGDGGTLFYTAVFILIASLIILFANRKNIPILGDKL